MASAPPTGEPDVPLLHYVEVGGSVNGAGYLVLTWAGLSPRLAVTVLLPVSLWADYQLHFRLLRRVVSRNPSPEAG